MIRNVGLDAARAIAMMFVVATHAAVSFMVTPIGWAVQDRSQNLGVDLWVWIVRAFAMPTFFWLAGYFSRALLGDGLRAFARHRALRIALPLAIALVPMSFAIDALWDWGRAVAPRGIVDASIPKFQDSEVPIRLGHLWFLYYLLWLSLAGAIAALVRVRLPDRAVLAVPIAMTFGTLVYLGALHTDTPLGFVPNIPILVYMGGFFAWGWLVHARPDELARYGRHAWHALAIAPLLLAPIIVGLAHGEAPMYTIAASALFSIAVMIFLLGACTRYGTPNRAIRFASESSYWFYIAHFPVVVLLQIALARVAVPGPLKYLAIVATTTLVCLGTYAVARKLRA